MRPAARPMPGVLRSADGKAFWPLLATCASIGNQRSRGRPAILGTAPALGRDSDKRATAGSPPLLRQPPSHRSPLSHKVGVRASGLASLPPIYRTLTPADSNRSLTGGPRLKRLPRPPVKAGFVVQRRLPCNPFKQHTVSTVEYLRWPNHYSAPQSRMHSVELIDLAALVSIHAPAC